MVLNKSASNQCFWILILLVVFACKDHHPCKTRPLANFCNDYIQCPSLYDLKVQCSMDQQSCSTRSSGCLIFKNDTTHMIYYFRPDPSDTGPALGSGLVAVDNVDPDAKDFCATGPNVRYGDRGECAVDDSR